jgi:hypothetical protein
MAGALAYYRDYRFERSRASADDMVVDDLVDLTDGGRRSATFLTVLEELVKAAGAGFQEVLLVGHGHPEGLAMPLGVPQFGSADKSGLRVVKKFADVHARIQRVKGLVNPEERVQGWRRLVDDFAGTRLIDDPQRPVRFGPVQGSTSDLSEAEAEQLFHQIAPRVVGRSAFKNAEFLRLLELHKQVTDLKLKRLEIRACNMAQDPDAMPELRSFLGVDRLLAPLVYTFYVRVPISVRVFIDEQFRMQEARYVSPAALASTSPIRWLTYGPLDVKLNNCVARVQSMLRTSLETVRLPFGKRPAAPAGAPGGAPGNSPGNGAMAKDAPDPSFYLRFTSSTVGPGFARGETAMDNTAVRLFVNNVLDLGHKLNYQSGPFRLAGFDALRGRNGPPPEAHNKALVLPSDPEYRDLIREVS